MKCTILTSRRERHCFQKVEENYSGEVKAVMSAYEEQFHVGKSRQMSGFLD